MLRWGGIPSLIILHFVGLGRTFFSYLAASFLLVVIGGIDDRRGLGFITKFFAMLAAITTVIFGGGITIHQIGTYGSMGVVKLGILAIPFTYLCIVGVTNSINLIDGLNGLAGGLSFFASLFIGVAAYLSRNFELAGVCIGFTGALAGFLFCNFGTQASIFMGDSGSLFLGFSLSVFSILLTQDPKFHVEPLFPVLVLLIPIFDTVRVMGRAFSMVETPSRLTQLTFTTCSSPEGLPVTGIVDAPLVTHAHPGCDSSPLIQRTSMPYLLMVLGTSLLFSIFANSLVKERERVSGTDPAARAPVARTNQIQQLRVIRKSANDA